MPPRSNGITRSDDAYVIHALRAWVNDVRRVVDTSPRRDHLPGERMAGSVNRVSNSRSELTTFLKNFVRTY
jgi:hypothetical protein